MKREKLIKQLESKNYKRRLEALEIIHTEAQKNITAINELLPSVINQLTVDDDRIKLKSLAILLVVVDRQPKLIEEGIPRLIRMISPLAHLTTPESIPSFDMFSTAIECIGKYVPQGSIQMVKSSIPYLSKCLSHPLYHPETFRLDAVKLYGSALRALVKIGMKQSSYIRGHSNCFVRCFLDSFKYTKLKAHADRKGSFRWWARYGTKLGINIEPENVIPILINNLRTLDKTVHLEIFNILTELCINTQIADIILNSVITTDPVVRDSCLQILSKVGSNNPDIVLPSISKGMDSKDKERRKFAIETLGRIGSKRPDNVNRLIPQLILKLKDPYTEVRIATIETFGNIGSAKPELVVYVIPHLIEALNSPDGNIRWRTIQTLEQIGKRNFDLVKQAIGMLVHLLRDPVNEVRWCAAKALENLGVDASKFIQAAEKIRTVYAMASELSRAGIDCTRPNELIYHARSAIDRIDCEQALNYAVEAENILYELKRSEATAVAPSPPSPLPPQQPATVRSALTTEYPVERPSYKPQPPPQPQPQQQPPPGILMPKITTIKAPEKPLQLEPQPTTAAVQESEVSTDKLVQEMVGQLMEQRRAAEQRKKKKKEMNTVFISEDIEDIES